MDHLKLLGSGVLVVLCLLGLFALSDYLHIGMKWPFMLALSVGFFVSVAWDYRLQFRSPAFVLFLMLWLVLHLLIFSLVFKRFGWFALLAAMSAELFCFYGSAYLLFKLEPPQSCQHRD